MTKKPGKYALAALWLWWANLTWRLCRFLPADTVEEIYDQALMRAFECSLDFEPVQVIVGPEFWACPHFKLSCSSMRGKPVFGCGCDPQPVWTQSRAAIGR
jgi:hypothetical protein